jgi:TPR repeat protein
MATREEIAYIREARAGKASAQLLLGKYYLSGGAGLKKNIPTALYWLHRAAARNEREAWMLIGSEVPFEIAIQSQDQEQLCVWYERAYDDGVLQAGVVWAKLLLSRASGEADYRLPYKALAALEKAADAGIVEAQWLLAKELKRAGHIVTRLVPAADAANDAGNAAATATKVVEKGALAWATRAAANGVLQAQRSLAERAWSMQDFSTFLRWSGPVARAIADQSSRYDSSDKLSTADAAFLSRYAKTMHDTGGFDAVEIERLWELAAEAGDKDAQYSLGLWYANMDESGERVESARKSNYKKAIHWLMQAGQTGLAKAWYSLFKICVRPNTGLSQLSLSDAQRYLERAAEGGHCGAQLELGMATWRARRNKEANDVVAAYWLQKAAAQGSGDALALLRKIATRATPAPWAQAAQAQLTFDLVSTYPFLAARVELAALFGLSLPEALLLDLNAADQGHCLLIDIRSLHARSKRRLILIETGEERLALTRIVRHFTNIDCGPNGPEGNYRQRLYVAQKLFPVSGMERKAMLKSAVKPI